MYFHINPTDRSIVLIIKKKKRGYIPTINPAALEQEKCIPR